MNGANRTAGEIVTYVAMQRGDMAALRTRDLMNQTSYILARWDNRLSEGSKNKMLTAREELVSINRVLTRGAVHDLSPKAKAKLSQACQQLNSIFSEEYGRAIRESEGGVH